MEKVECFTHWACDIFDKLAGGNILPLTRQECVSNKFCMTTKTPNCSRCNLSNHQMMGGGFCLPDRRRRDPPLNGQAHDSAVQVTSFLCLIWRIRPLAVQLCTVCRSVLGGSWQANCAGNGNQGFTSAAIFELRRRQFSQDFFKWENCHPNFSYHAH